MLKPETKGFWTQKKILQNVIIPAILAGHPCRHDSLGDRLLHKQQPKHILLSKLTQFTNNKT